MSNNLYRVLLVENTPPRRKIPMGTFAGNTDGEAIDNAKKAMKPFLNSLELGPNAYSFTAEKAT